MRNFATVNRAHKVAQHEFSLQRGSFCCSEQSLEYGISGTFAASKVYLTAGRSFQIIGILHFPCSTIISSLQRVAFGFPPFSKFQIFLNILLLLFLFFYFLLLGKLRCSEFYLRYNERLRTSISQVQLTATSSHCLLQYPEAAHLDLVQFCCAPLCLLQRIRISLQ